MKFFLSKVGGPEFSVVLKMSITNVSMLIFHKCCSVSEEVHTQVATTNVKLTLVSKLTHPPNVTSSVANINKTKIECHKIP